MADMNDFLKKLLAGSPQTNVASPMMAPTDARPKQVEADEFGYDPADDMPAEEDEDEGPYVAPMKKGAPLMSKDVIDKIQAIPLPESQKSIRAPAEMQAPVATPVMSPVDEQVSKVSKMENLLKQLQEDRASRQTGLNGLRGANQIAQAFAMGSGAKIGDGSEAVNALEKQLDQPLKDYAGQIADQEDNPSSDISKFMRQQAYAVLKKLSPETNYDGKLENMSANQLKKLPGMKNIGESAALQWVATDRVTRDGSPVKFNKATGEYMNGLTGKIIAPGESVVRDIARKNPGTGNYGYADRGGGFEDIATGSLTAQPRQDESGKPKEYKFSDVQTVGPAVAERFEKAREKFNADMKDSREVATSVTNLASKLKPGPNNEVDSGLLGGIQTQAAKMAGQKGVLTDQDLVKFAGAGGVGPKIERIVNGSMFGDMSESDIKFFKRFSQLMGKSLESDIENRSELFAEQGRQSLEKYLPGVTTDNVKKFLGVDKVAPVVQDKSTSNIKGEVKRKTADGKVAIFDAKTKKFLRYEENEKK